jgi:hypothetical protein
MGLLLLTIELKGEVEMAKRMAGMAVLIFAPFFLMAQSAGDIIVPEGYQVRKIAETNKAVEPYGFAFDDEGNMIVAGWDSIYRIDPAGNVNKLCFTRSRG